MDDIKALYIRLDFWDHTVGAFEPAKVLRQLQLCFPEVEIDPTDHQRVRLLFELDFWARTEMPAERRESLVEQSWSNYRTNGPSYRFIIPFPPNHQVAGQARRLSVGFQTPPGLPEESRERLLSFLQSLQMGEPTLDSDRQSFDPKDESIRQT